MSFDNPEILFFLFSLVFFIPIYFIRHRKSREATALFAASAPSAERKSLLRELRHRMLISDVFFVLFIAFLIIALAGPRWGLRIVADHRRGVDLILAFDLSRSMNVNDGSSTREPASRLDRGIEIAMELTESLDNLRLGIVIGRGRGVLAVPLTHDSETIMAFLNALDGDALSGGGTNLESIIDAAEASFQDSIPSRRGIILFSDGEALTGSFQAAVERSRRARINISAVGLGTERGGPVPFERGGRAPEGFLLGPDGRQIISTRVSAPLRNAADRTGGVYVDGGSQNAAKLLLEYINSLSAESWLSGHRRESNPRWQIFVIAAMACLGGMRIMGFSRRDPPPKGMRAGAVLLCLLLFNSCAKSQGQLLVMEGNFFNTRGLYTQAISSYLRALNHEEAAPYAEYGLGSAFFALEEGSAALERYREAAIGLANRQQDHPELRYRIYYNTGIIFFEQGEYDEAVQAFRNALRVDGSRIEAKRNLELSLISAERQAQAAASFPGDEGQETSMGRASVLFDYLRAKEQEQWRSREWSGESDYSGPDY